MDRKLCIEIWMNLLILLFYINFAECRNSRNYWQNENIPLDLSENLVYSSSTAPSSDPYYATDDDMISCIETQTGYTDQGFHWVLVDLGFLVENITQVHLATNSIPPENSALSSDITVWGARQLSSLPQLIGGSFNVRQGIDWSNFESCSDSGVVSPGVMRVTLHCEQPLRARWLLISRKDVLNFCYLQVLVNEYRPDCYTQVDQSSSDLSVFRNERYLGLQRCRQLCSQETSCQGLAYQGSNRPHSGVCDLLFTSRSSRAHKPVCGAECRMEENRCNKGDAKRLVKKKGFQYKLYYAPEGWYLISVQIDAIITCESGQCAPIKLIVTDKDNRNWTCTYVYAQEVSLLKRKTLTCDEPIKNANLITLEATSDSNNQLPQPTIKSLFNANARVLPQLPTTIATFTTKITRPTPTQSTSKTPNSLSNSSSSSPTGLPSLEKTDPIGFTTKNSNSKTNKEGRNNAQENDNKSENKEKDDGFGDEASTKEIQSEKDFAAEMESVLKDEESGRLPYLWIIILAACLVFLIVIIAVILMAFITRRRRKSPQKKPFAPENGDQPLLTSSNNGHSIAHSTSANNHHDTPLIVIKDEDNNDVTQHTTTDESSSLCEQVLANGNAAADNLETYS